MTYTEAKKIATKKMMNVPVSTLKEAAILSNDNMSDEADFALDVVLDILMEKMEEKDFIAFCDAM